MMKTILETSAMMPMLKDMMKFADTESIAKVVSKAAAAIDPGKVGQASVGQASVGQASGGQASGGQASGGQAPVGQAPRVERE